ncbi:hypothetical protein Tco_0334739 [Tanacetum coccineum]
MSSSTHPIIVPSDYDVKDAFSFTHSLDSTISPFHDDPYMKVMQAYNESPIPPQAPIAPPTILPPSPMFDTRDFFLPEEILPP